MKSTLTRKAVPTRIPYLYISLMVSTVIILWAVGYAQSIPFVFFFSLMIGGPLMNLLTYEIHDEKEQSVAPQTVSAPEFASQKPASTSRAA